MVDVVVVSLMDVSWTESDYPRHPLGISIPFQHLPLSAGWAVSRPIINSAPMDLLISKSPHSLYLSPSPLPEKRAANQFD